MSARAVLFAIAMVFQGAGPVRAQDCAIPPDGQKELLVIFDLVNAERMRFGLPRLESSVELTLSAQAHACDMVARGRFGHAGKGGLSQRVRTAGCRTRVSGETIALGQRSGVEAVQTWFSSPRHKQVLLMQRADSIGLGVAAAPGGRGGLHWVVNVAQGC